MCINYIICNNPGLVVTEFVLCTFICWFVSLNWLYRPGLSRLNFPYFLSKGAVDYIIQSVTMVAKHGWKLLPQVCGNTMIHLNSLNMHKIVNYDSVKPLAQYRTHLGHYKFSCSVPHREAV